MLSASSEASRSTAQDLSGVCILVLDDDPNMRSLIRGALLRCRCENIVLSGQAGDALPLFSTRTIDLVILDWMMAPMSGYEFLRELRRPERAIKVPVIVLSASSEPRDVAMAQQFNISGWLTKPIALPELMRQISSVLALPAGKFAADPDFGIDAERLTERYRSKLADDLRLLETDAGGHATSGGGRKFQLVGGGGARARPGRCSTASCTTSRARREASDSAWSPRSPRWGRS